MSPNAIHERILPLFRERGRETYFGEAVSQTEHALQAACEAEREGAGPALVAAALLHDIGHLLHNRPEDCAEAGIDARHEELGARWLEQFFGPEVTEPIRLHVAAKRYLCAIDPAYFGRLSEASILSLKAQGGPFAPEEAEAFHAGPHAEAAVALRRWDEMAKVKGCPTPDLRHFIPLLESVYVRQS